ncbi:MAG: ankyrin repeat domain-containing protein [Alphaproteobacteria bacterium]|nr:ankyrin repeat domain-containing protein [Alphaproteobacteria bacterium]
MPLPSSTHNDNALKMVILVGSKMPSDHIKSLKAACKQLPDGSYTIIGNGQDDISDKEVKALEGKIGPQTQIHILAHGSVNDKGEHACLLMRKKQPTKEIFEKISALSPSPSPEQPSGSQLNRTQVHLWSCYGGAAAKSVDVLKNAVLVTHARRDTISVVLVSVDGMIGYINRKKDAVPLLTEFYHNATIAPETQTLVLRDPAITINCYPPSTPIVSKEAAAKHLSNLRDDLIVAYSNSLQESSPDVNIKDEIANIQRINLSDTVLQKYIEGSNYSNLMARMSSPDFTDKTSLKDYESLLPYFNSKGNFVLCKTLLEHGADPNVRSEDGMPLLHQAIHDERQMNLLLLHGADPSVTMNGLTAYDMAKQEDSRACSAILERFKENKVYWAAENKIEIDISQHLATNTNLNARYGEEQKTLLHLYAEQGNVKNIEVLLERGADAGIQDGEGKAALHLAAESGHLGAVQLLVEGRDVNQIDGQGLSPLYFAASNGHKDIVRYLIVEGADMRSGFEEQNLMHLSVRNNLPYSFSCCLKEGSFIDERDYYGQTPLHIAVEEGNLKCIQYSASKGENLDMTDSDGRTLLHTAVICSKEHIAKYLIKKAKLDVNSKDNNNNTPLHYAVVYNNDYIMRNLMDHPQINLNVKDELGNTPLHIAVSYGNTELVTKLLEKGADPTLTNNDNKTPMSLAEALKQKSLVEVLKNSSASHLQHNALSLDFEGLDLISGYEVEPPAKASIEPTNRLKPIKKLPFTEQTKNKDKPIGR